MKGDADTVLFTLDTMFPTLRRRDHHDNKVKKVYKNLLHVQETVGTEEGRVKGTTEYEGGGNSSVVACALVAL